MAERRTSRERVADATVDLGALRRLVDAVRSEAASLAVLETADQRLGAAALVAEGDAIQWAQPPGSCAVAVETRHPDAGRARGPAPPIDQCAGHEVMKHARGRPTGVDAQAALPGIAYFALAFGLGFLLGTARTLFVEDAPGARRLLGVLIELPIMLGASWFLCRIVVRRFAVAPTAAARAVMGGVALALLLLAELAVGALLFGRTPGEHFALYGETSYALGLAAQIAFALMPLVQLRMPEQART